MEQHCAWANCVPHRFSESAMAHNSGSKSPVVQIGRAEVSAPFQYHHVVGIGVGARVPGMVVVVVPGPGIATKKVYTINS